MSTSTRELVKQAYPYKSWYIKVDKMTDAQIYALFLRLRREGKI
jgi:hypothetical protein